MTTVTPCTPSIEAAGVAVPPRWFVFEHRSRTRARVLVHHTLSGPPSPDAAIVFVLPGARRNGADYRDAWAAHAAAAGVSLFALEFPSAGYAGAAGYNLAGMIDAGGGLTPPSTWAYATIDALFRYVRRCTGSRRRGYRLYGHSAGAQLVHRMVMFSPASPIERAVAANAGWYTMPDEGVVFPYGLGGAPITRETLATALTRELVVVLGERDTDAAHPRLRTDPQAARQGATRLARGRAFIGSARRAARALGVPLGWRLVTVPDVGHSNRALLPAAARLLLD